MFIATNMSTGAEYKGKCLIDAYKEAAWDQLPGEKITVKEINLPGIVEEAVKIFNSMQSYDPNGTWDEVELDSKFEIEAALCCAVATLTYWANEESDQFIKSKYYSLIMDIEELI